LLRLRELGFVEKVHEDASEHRLIENPLE
jgi:hypothetical protein